MHEVLWIISGLDLYFAKVGLEFSAPDAQPFDVPENNDIRFYFIDSVCLHLLDSDSLWQSENNIRLSAIIFREDWLLWTVIVAGCKLGFRQLFFVMLDILLPTFPGARG